MPDGRRTDAIRTLKGCVAGGQRGGSIPDPKAEARILEMLRQARDALHASTRAPHLQRVVSDGGRQKERHTLPDFSTELMDNSVGKVAVTNPLCQHYRDFIEMPKS
jgi:hypothetical protein